MACSPKPANTTLTENHETCCYQHGATKLPCLETSREPLRKQREGKVNSIGRRWSARRHEPSRIHPSEPSNERGDNMTPTRENTLCASSTRTALRRLEQRLLIDQKEGPRKRLGNKDTTDKGTATVAQERRQVYEDGRAFCCRPKALLNPVVLLVHPCRHSSITLNTLVQYTDSFANRSHHATGTPPGLKLRIT